MKTSHTRACSSLLPLQNQQVISATHSSAGCKAYVYRGPTRATPSHSIFLTLRSRRTMLRFHYVEISKQRRDLPMSQGERASPELAGHLAIYHQPRQQKVWGEGQTLHFALHSVMEGLCNSLQIRILG